MEGVLTISNRKGRAVSSQEVPEVTWAEIKGNIDSLVGLAEVKEQLFQIARTLENVKEHQRRHQLKNMPPLHFAVTGPAGGGKKRIAGILGQLLQYYGLAQKPLHIVTPQNFTELPNADAGQPLYVPLAPQLLPEGRRNTNLVLHLFWVHLARLAEEQTVILGVHSPGGEQFMAGLDLAERIQFHIHIPVYSWGDFLAYARRYAAGYKFKLSRPAVEELREVIERQKQDPEFRNMVTVQRLIDGAIINYYIDPGEDAPQGREFATLQPQHIRPTAAPREEELEPAEDPLAQLNKLVGLDEVKMRVGQLMALVNLEKRRREQGLPTEPITTHMVFSGPPGTGKTTVARLVGQALKQLGVLEKGHLVEVSREDLVGQFVGHTAQKTAEVVEKALGGVLYIDECYSLNGGHTSDYGKEAVATLIKHMEDSRSKLTVIFSGYGQETEEFLQMNPGLRSRIQFHIPFAHYTAQELFQIFLTFCQEQGYELAPDAAEELEALLQRLSQGKGENFANGRLVRSLFERAKLNLASRVWAAPDQTSLSLIQLEDIHSLTGYSDVAGMLQVRPRIGFQLLGA